MDIDKRILLLKEVYEENQTIDFFTEDAERIYDINIDDNIICYTVSVTLGCGCCGDYEQRTNELDWFIFYMSESDFNDFIEHIKNNPK
jgi:hypothetical protein